MANVTIKLQRPIKGQSQINYDDSEFQTPEEAINFALEQHGGYDPWPAKQELPTNNIDLAQIYNLDKKQSDLLKKQMSIVKDFEYPDIDQLTKENLQNLSAIAEAMSAIRNASNRKRQYFNEFDVSTKPEGNLISELMSGNLFKKIQSGADTGSFVGPNWRVTGAPSGKNDVSDTVPFLSMIMENIDPAASTRRGLLETDLSGLAKSIFLKGGKTVTGLEKYFSTAGFPKVTDTDDLFFEK